MFGGLGQKRAPASRKRKQTSTPLQALVKVPRTSLAGRAALAAAMRPRTTQLERQVRALIQSKKRDAVDVDRDSTPWSATTISCLTSTTNFATAASGTGVLDLDGDSCLINSVRFKGFMENAAALDLDPVGNTDVLVRQIVVWFFKPLLVASAAGTLPPITEVLVADDIASLYVTDAANAGRFVKLSDKTWDLGNNSYQAVTAVGHSRVSGRNCQLFDYVVKVNKTCHFAAVGQSGTPSGHYDSDVANGRIDRGLLCVYTMVRQVGTVTCNINCATRLNYTG